MSFIRSHTSSVQKCPISRSTEITSERATTPLIFTIDAHSPGNTQLTRLSADGPQQQMTRLVIEDFVAEMHRKHWTMNKRPLFTLDGCHASVLLPGDAWTVGADRIGFLVFPLLRHFASNSFLAPNGVHPRAGHLFAGPFRVWRLSEPFLPKKGRCESSVSKN